MTDALGDDKYRGPYDRRQSDRNLAEHARVVTKVEAVVDALRDDMGEMKTSLQALAQAMTRVVLMEERQVQLTDRTQDMEKRLRALEVAAPGSRRAEEWVDKALWALLGCAGSLILKLWH